mmetsp:Transcript_2844/g.6236  ORF Transcript_2844/g.6236 Transcript_2844/m.6236 type:complete len:286 (+) Transcript_2844:1154-2011(+)
MGATRVHLLLVQGSNAGQHAALQQLQRSTTSSGDVAHLGGDASLLHSGHRVTATDDGDGTLGGDLSQLVGNAHSALGKLGELEHTHGAVPDHGLGVIQGLVEQLNGLGANVKTQPVIGDVVDVNDLVVGVGIELVSHHHVHGQQQLHALLLGQLLQLLGQVQLVLLNQGLADLEAAGLVEGEDHATTNDDLVSLVEQGLNDSDLGGHLGATHNGHEGLLGVLDSTVQVVQLLLQQEAGHSRLQELGHTLSGGVGAVSSTEGVVDVQVSVGSQLLAELGIVLLSCL